MKDFYLLTELSEMLEMNIRTLREYVRKGELKASKVGRKYIVQKEDFNAFLEKRRTN